MDPEWVQGRAQLLPAADQWIDSEDPLVQAQAADYSHWWGVFDDPVLNELVEAAYEQNLPLNIAGMRILEARSQFGAATGNLFPQQQRMNGAYARTRFSENAFPFGMFGLPKSRRRTSRCERWRSDSPWPERTSISRRTPSALPRIASTRGW